MYYREKEEIHMTISLRLSDEDTMLFKKYAEIKGMTVSELVRQSVMERIEDEFDLSAYEKAFMEYKKNPITYTLDEVERELGLK